MCDLTDADGFELVDVEYRKTYADERDAEWLDRTDGVEIDRWSKYGNDRLYMNGLRTGDGYLDLKTGESGGDRWTKVSAEYELDGDTLVITVGNRRPRYRLTIRVHGDAFEADDEADDDGEDGVQAADAPEVACDGGEDVTAHVDDETIKQAIAAHDDPEHTDATTVADIRELLAHLQHGAEEAWGVYMDHIESGSMRVVAETRELLVLATGEHRMYEADLQESYTGDVDLDGPAIDVLAAVMHDLAREHSEYDWGYEYPLVLRKPSSFDAGQRYVEAVVNGLQRRGCAPGQAWAYYGTQIRGESLSRWAKRVGHGDHTTVRKAAEKAKAELV